MRGLSFESLVIDAEGPVGDREFVIVDDSGRFLTQRQLPRMALVFVQRTDSKIMFEYDGDRVEALLDGECFSSDVVVWGDTVRARHVHGLLDGFLTEKLGRSVRLFQSRPGQLRQKTSPGDDHFSMRFPDSSQILLTTEESRADLSRHVGYDLVHERFRANVIVKGFPAWSEESWKTVRLGDLEFEVMKPCTRCKIITIDPQAVEYGPSTPLEALKTIVKGAQTKANFGVHLRVLQPGVIRLNDDVEFSL